MDSNRQTELKLPMQLSKLFTEFFNSEKASGFILIGCTILSLIIANTGLGEAYSEFLVYKAW